MNLEFKVYKIKEDSRTFKICSKYNTNNEFIIVGEEKIEDKEYFKAQQIGTQGMFLVKGI